MEWNLLVIGSMALLGLYIMTTAMYRPLRWLLKSAWCLVVGTVLLILLNWGLEFLDMHVSYNLFTVLVAGILQLPGLVMLVLMNHWFV